MVKIGIDLGTTNTLACYMKNGKPRLVRFPGGEMLPSVLYEDETGKVYVGELARKKGVFDPLNRIRSSKTYMGDATKTWEINGHSYTPTMVATEILKDVKAAVIKNLKLAEDEEIEAVITVPAYFNSNQKDETKKAGVQAGIFIKEILEEPVAAAVAYVKSEKLENQKVFVVDLGGGTFDVSILEVKEKRYSVLAKDGDRRLGGDDFDKKLYEYIIDHVGSQIGKDLSSQETSELEYAEYYQMTGRVLEAAIEAKVALSTRLSTEISISNLFTYENIPYNLDLTIDRNKFYELCSDLFNQINSRIKKVLTDNSISANDIGIVILAGGSCYIPKIKEDVELILNKETKTENLSTMVATGACFRVYSMDDLTDGDCFENIISHSLGIKILDVDNKEILRKILNKNDKYPTMQKKTFTTSIDNQESVEIVVYEAGSDKEDLAEIENHDLYGSFILDGIQQAPAGVPKIDVTFDYNSSGLLTVTAEDKTTGSKKEVQVKKGMTETIVQKKDVSPVDFELLIDVSGSMDNSKLKEAKEASKYLINELIDFNVHRLGVIAFGASVREVCSLTQDKEQLCSSIQRLNSNGGTPMNYAIVMGAEKLGNSINKKSIIIVTDGEPDDKNSTKKCAVSAMNNGIDVICIAVGCSDSARSFLNSLASKPEFAFSIENMSELSNIFERVVQMYLSEV